MEEASQHLSRLLGVGVNRGMVSERPPLFLGEPDTASELELPPEVDGLDALNDETFGIGDRDCFDEDEEDAWGDSDGEDEFETLAEQTNAARLDLDPPKSNLRLGGSKTTIEHQQHSPRRPPTMTSTIFANDLSPAAKNIDDDWQMMEESLMQLVDDDEPHSRKRTPSQSLQEVFNPSSPITPFLASNLLKGGDIGTSIWGVSSTSTAVAHRKVTPMQQQQRRSLILQDSSIDSGGNILDELFQHLNLQKYTIGGTGTGNMALPMTPNRIDATHQQQHQHSMTAAAPAARTAPRTVEELEAEMRKLSQPDAVGGMPPLSPKFPPPPSTMPFGMPAPRLPVLPGSPSPIPPPLPQLSGGHPAMPPPPPPPGMPPNPEYLRHWMMFMQQQNQRARSPVPPGMMTSHPPPPHPVGVRPSPPNIISGAGVINGTGIGKPVPMPPPIPIPRRPPMPGSWPPPPPGVLPPPFMPPNLATAGSPQQQQQMVRAAFLAYMSMMGRPPPPISNQQNQQQQQTQQSRQRQHGNMKTGQQRRDPYGGLLSRREREWMLKIQMLQVYTDDPEKTDFYWTEYRKRRPQLPIRRENTSPDRKLSRRQSDSESMKPPETPYVYVPPKFEGSLGKVQYVSANCPRQLLDMGENVNFIGQGDSSSQNAHPHPSTVSGHPSSVSEAGDPGKLSALAKKRGSIGALEEQLSGSDSSLSSSAAGTKTLANLLLARDKQALLVLENLLLLVNECEHLLSKLGPAGLVWGDNDDESPRSSPPSLQLSLSNACDAQQSDRALLRSKLGVLCREMSWSQWSCLLNALQLRKGRQMFVRFIRLPLKPEIAMQITQSLLANRLSIKKSVCEEICSSVCDLVKRVPPQNYSQILSTASHISAQSGPQHACMLSVLSGVCQTPGTRLSDGACVVVRNWAAGASSSLWVIPSSSKFATARQQLLQLLSKCGVNGDALTEMQTLLTT